MDPIIDLKGLRGGAFRRSGTCEGTFMDEIAGALGLILGIPAEAAEAPESPGEAPTVLLKFTG